MLYLDGGYIIEHSGDMFTHFNPDCLVEKTATSCNPTTLEDCKLKEEMFGNYNWVENGAFVTVNNISFLLICVQKDIWRKYRALLPIKLKVVRDFIWNHVLKAMGLFSEQLTIY